MNQFKGLYYDICSLLPTRFLQRLSSPGTLFPYHHLVSNDALPHIRHLYKYKNEAQFRKDLDGILRYFKPVEVQDIIDAVDRGTNLPRNSFLLSFDDGLREVYDVVAPLLLEKGIPAIFFVNPAFIDNRELFYRCKISLVIDEMEKKKNDEKWLRNLAAEAGCTFASISELRQSIKAINNRNKKILERLGELVGISDEDFLRRVKPFLTTEQILGLKSQGFTIGAHSWDHPYFQTLTLEEQLGQVRSSIDFVKEQFKEPHLTFSFPHSDEGISQQLFDELLLYDPGIRLYFGIRNQKTELRNRMFHRFNAERPELSMNQQLNGMLTAILFRRIFGTNKVRRK